MTKYFLGKNGKRRLEYIHILQGFLPFFTKNRKSDYGQSLSITIDGNCYQILFTP